MRLWTLYVAGSFLLGASLSAQERIGREKKTIKLELTDHESENYAIRYETVISSNVVSTVAGELEDILKQYIRIFGAKRRKDDEKFKVVIVDSLNTFEQVGGDPSHPGFYSSSTKNLVLRQMPFYDLIPITYHEAFHQYLHFYMGDGPGIPTWFNEGMATYFEGMERNKGDKKLNPKLINHRKLRMVKDKVFTRQEIALEALIDAGYKEFHAKDKESLYYTQSFAVIYYLMEVSGGKTVRAYMKELKKSGEVESANSKIFGKKRSKLKGIEKKWKAFMLNVKVS